MDDQIKKTATHLGKILLRLPRLKVGEIVRFAKGRRQFCLLGAADGAFLFDPAEKPTFIELAELKQQWKPMAKSWGTWRYDTADVLPLPMSMARRILVALKKSPNKQQLVHANYIRTVSAVTNVRFAWSKQIGALLKKARKAYYDGSPLMEDAEFDYLEDLVRAYDPKNPVLQQVGATPTERKVKLPYNMASLDKLKAGGSEASTWVKKSGGGPLYVSAKIDGMSMSVEYRNGNLVAAYSRGDGEIGQLSTEHAKLISTIPRTINAKGKVVVRGELVIPNSTFAAKYSKDFANPRNFVGGLINSKTAGPALKDCEFLAHALMGVKMTKQQANTVLRKYGFTLPPTLIIKSPTAALDATLSKRLATWKKELDMDIDGLVITVDNAKAAKQETDSGNPTFSRAFKETTTSFRAVVGEVEWNESRYGLLKPRIRLAKGVKHAGVTITYATAHNAAYVRDNGIGPGAVLELQRSGDVIPFVLRVIKKVKPQLPKGKWEWTSSGVDIQTIGAESIERTLQKLTHFFAALGVENVGYGVISKLHDAGLTSVPDILAASVRDLQEIEGFQNRMAQKVYDSIHKALSAVTLPQLAYASAIFDRGLGREKFGALFAEYGDEMFDWKGWTVEDVVEEVASIQGFGVKSARQFATGIKEFLRFFSLIKKWVTLKRPEKARSAKLKGKVIVWTGFRDAQQEQRVTSNGGKVGGSVSKDTTILVTKSLDATSSKAVKAKQLGVKVMSRSQFDAWLTKQGV